MLGDVIVAEEKELMERQDAPCDTTEDITFQALVMDCASDLEFVHAFNRAYGLHLKAPITELLEGRWPSQVTAQEEFAIGCFIAFIHQTLWQRLQRAQLASKQPRSRRTHADSH